MTKGWNRSRFLRITILLIVTTGIGFTVGWIYGEYAILGHVGTIPPFFAIPGGLIGLVIGFCILLFQNLKNRFGKQSPRNEG